MGEVKVTKDIENRTLLIEREFDAPIEKVWKAYAEKEWFEKWWGPEGWETTTKEFDFSVGGKIHYCMKCVDKNQGEWYDQESWGLMIIESIDAPRSFMAQDHFSNPEGTVDSKMPIQKLGVELIEENGKTRLIGKSITETVEDLEKLITMGMVEGFSSQLNKLEQLIK